MLYSTSKDVSPTICWCLMDKNIALLTSGRWLPTKGNACRSLTILERHIRRSFWSINTNAALQIMACKASFLTLVVEAVRVVDKSSCYRSSRVVVGRHQVVGILGDGITSTPYRPQAVHEIRSERVTMDDKSPLVKHTDDVNVQDKQHHDHNRPNLQKEQSFQRTFASKS